MIFTEAHAQMVIDRTKRQTRRPVKPTDVAVYSRDGSICRVLTHPRFGRLKWQVGDDYAAQPGRGKKSIGRTPPVKEIRRERLWEITPADCIDEGITAHLVLFDHEYYRVGSEVAFRTPREAFEDLWESFYHKPSYRYQGFRWRDNPEVWVLEFMKQ